MMPLPCAQPTTTRASSIQIPELFLYRTHTTALVAEKARYRATEPTVPHEPNEPIEAPAPPEEAPAPQEIPPASVPEQTPTPDEWRAPPNEQEPSDAPIEMPLQDKTDEA